MKRFIRVYGSGSGSVRHPGLNNYYDADWSNNLFHFITEPHYSTRGHKFKLYKHAPNTKLGENCFTVRVINNWNALPEHVVCSTSLTFKNALEYHWKSFRVKYDPDV